VFNLWHWKKKVRWSSLLGQSLPYFSFFFWGGGAGYWSFALAREGNKPIHINSVRLSGGGAAGQRARGSTHQEEQQEGMDTVKEFRVAIQVWITYCSSIIISNTPFHFQK
jgi:hypothetical protein